ncbi:MAG: twin-arginine translocase TatA/TatE family subunit [Bacteroidales bacterium]|jgi:sec-independent protein translocase protein TatA|nr:twin-arginine translocase TatA/TatE family subunit [Bacteroidales bacterium]MBR2105510.1 twin-arginine translocase TatA/TatE family subunit [Bacteroidales bacterium]MBR2201916.1 twin-arginine translocase TatA/TatE family subunit [Bacteroidales bacterium]
MLLGIIGGQELIVILIIALLIFGGKKIPELMRGLGKGVKEYKNALHSVDDDEQKGKDDGNSPTPPDNNTGNTQK